MKELNLDKMPDSAFAKKEEKDYNVTITECKLVTATTGTKPGDRSSRNVGSSSIRYR